MFCISTICNDVLSRLIYGVIFCSLYYKNMVLRYIILTIESNVK